MQEDKGVASQKFQLERFISSRVFFASFFDLKKSECREVAAVSCPEKQRTHTHTQVKILNARLVSSFFLLLLHSAYVCVCLCAHKLSLRFYFFLISKKVQQVFKKFWGMVAGTLERGGKKEYLNKKKKKERKESFFCEG